MHNKIDILERALVETEGKDYRERVEAMLDVLSASEDKEKHEIEHEFLREMIGEWRARKELYKTVKVKVISGGVWALCSGIFLMVVYSMKSGFFNK